MKPTQHMSVCLVKQFANSAAISQLFLLMSNVKSLSIKDSDLSDKKEDNSGFATGALKWPLHHFQNPLPTKIALKIHHLKGSEKSRP